MSEAFDLGRFLRAQEPVLEQVRRELREGQKRSHWMWFIFPQLRGLGQSEMAWRYGIASREEARVYLEHPLLGPRLRECTALVLAAGRPLRQMLGSPDDLKFHSCMSLFAAVAPEESVFREALARYFGGTPDPRTVEMLRAPEG
ncbi:DUF1810 domain-containing protein [Roseomonas marmotae]|uniref:DUF1810 domain-containing protein n=1 Tax=Roseomonas marmotae TaxID=2768161 RepID=A0ABS3KC37_9PROT|nr:DUF1810 domain-containing protein [Roseomonas marmotae]MBO1075044.1 DUF1810 domain-containing protein [Roseomonas marmotae]QTI79923.1 DUF1810 domain-containing protein [Roseomonas marmotae]